MKIFLTLLSFLPLMLHAATFDSSIASLARLNLQTSMAINTQGIVDQRFGAAGGIAFPLIAGTTNNYAKGMALRPDGTIVVGGYVVNGLDYYAAYSFVQSPISFFKSFGTNGYSIVPFTIIPSSFSGDSATTSLLQPDGKFIVGGNSTTAGGGNQRFSLARFTSTGSLDTTFGSGNGTTYITPTISGGTDDALNALYLQPDGKILAAGSTVNGNVYFALARFTTAGVLDTTFGTGGKAYIAGNIAGGSADLIKAIGIQSDGKIIVAGYSENGVGATFMSLARYTAAGVLDTTFGGGGTGYTYLTPTIAGGAGDQCNALIIQADNKIVLGGVSNSFFALARYNANGRLDTSFGTNGKTYVPYLISGAGADTINCLVVQSDGKILAGGQANDRTGLARFSANGILDTTFGTNGTTYYPSTISGLAQGASSIAITSAQNILVSTDSGQIIFDQFVNFPSASQFDQQYAGRAGLLA